MEENLRKNNFSGRTIDLFNGSGGSVKGSAVWGILMAIEKLGIKVRVFSGVSVSAILFACHVMGKTKEVSDIFLNINGNTIWGNYWNRPFGIGGIFRFIRSLITFKKPWMGEMKGIEKHLDNLITEDVFQAYKNDPETSDCYVLATDNLGVSRWWNIKELNNAQEVKERIMASASIPIFTKPITILIKGIKRFFTDGGVNDHSAGGKIFNDVRKLLASKGIEMKNMFTVFTRPKNFPIKAVDLLRINIIKFILVLVNKFFVRNTSLSDERIESLLSQIANIKYNPVYIPYFTKSLYDSSKKTAMKGFNLGQQIVEQNKHKFIFN